MPLISTPSDLDKNTICSLSADTTSNSNTLSLAQAVMRFQKYIIDKALYFDVKVFLATQVLKNMETKPIQCNDCLRPSLHRL